MASFKIIFVFFVASISLAICYQNRECKDVGRACEIYKSKGFCSIRRIARKVCRKTCGCCGLKILRLRKRRNFIRVWPKRRSIRIRTRRKPWTRRPRKTWPTTKPRTTTPKSTKTEKTTIKPTKVTSTSTTTSPKTTTTTMKPTTMKPTTRKPTTMKPSPTTKTTKMTTKTIETTKMTTIKPSPTTSKTTTPTTTTTTTKKPSTSTKAPTNPWIDECLKAHNGYRTLHVDTPDMVWDNNIQVSAQKWADNLATSVGPTKHSNSGYGENIYWSSDQSLVDACTQATKAWYDEIMYYDYNKPGFAQNTGHFTQVVWKASIKLGVGIARGPSGVYVVAQYSPAGNFLNRFRENVLPLRRINV